MDPIDCSRNIIALQTVVCMAMYFKSIAAQSMAHAFLSSATTASLRMGLHEQADAPHLSEQERQVREKTYCVLKILDTYNTRYATSRRRMQGVR